MTDCYQCRMRVDVSLATADGTGDSVCPRCLARQIVAGVESLSRWAPGSAFYQLLEAEIEVARRRAVRLGLTLPRGEIVA